MPELTVLIGGVAFDVACKEGEEGFLKTAAGMLDNEATALKSALGRIPENRMLLMAGLMLADKTASLEDELKKTSGDNADEALKKRLSQAEDVLQDTLAELSALKKKEAERTKELAVTQARLTEFEGAPSENEDDLRSQLETVQAELEAAKAAGSVADDLRTQLNEVQVAFEAEKATHSATKADRDEAFEAARLISAKLKQTAEIISGAT